MNQNPQEMERSVYFDNVDFDIIYDALITHEESLEQAKERKELSPFDATMQIELCKGIRAKIDILKGPIQAERGMDS